jgi:hypothetical protein
MMLKQFLQEKQILGIIVEMEYLHVSGWMP